MFRRTFVIAAALLVLDVSATIAAALPPRAAILADPSLPIVGCSTPAATFERALKSEGYEVELLDADSLSNAARFNAQQFSLLVVPTGATFPLAAHASLVDFVKHGGSLICTGGYAFDNLVIKENGKWVSQNQRIARAAQTARDPAVSRIVNGSFEDGLKDWGPSSPTACTVVNEPSPAGPRYAKAVCEHAEVGVSFSKQLSVTPGSTVLVSAMAKTSSIAGVGFAFLAVYQYGVDGKLITFRDFAQIHDASEWKRREARIAISPQAARVMFNAGLYLASGTLRFGDVTCAPVPAEVRINAHYGDPGDALGLLPDQMPLFSPDQKIEGVGLSASPNADLPMSWSSPGRVTGFEATAQLRGASSWEPLVDVMDSYGRRAGVAGAIISHYVGPFAGSHWAIFGVTNRDIFAGVSGETLLKSVVSRLKSGISVDPFSTNFALYHALETAHFDVAIRNSSSVSAIAEVSASIKGADPASAARTLWTSSSRSVTIEPGKSTVVSYDVPITASYPDIAAVRVRLSSNGIAIQKETGFCVESTRVTAAGISLKYRDNGFELHASGKQAARPILFGTDTWGSMFSSPSANPLTWYRDLEMMRDYGLHMFENLQYTPAGYQFTEVQQRQIDALIQLSQRTGLVYMAGLLIGQDVAVDDAELAKQAEFCHQFALRYRHVPGLIYYLNGDFQLHLKDTPDLRRLWNAFLTDKYRDDASLRLSRGALAPVEKLGAIPVAEAVAGSAFDLRAADTSAFQASLLRRWVNALTAAIRSADTEHPITSEYYQQPYSGVDLRLSIGNQDAANIGYFGPPPVDITRLLSTIKWNDMRRAGKAMNIGEFGVKTHDAWASEREPWGYQVARSDAYRNRLFSYMVHAAVACGVSKIQNWCWSDDPDGMFPWGTAFINPLRPRPALKLWRNLRLLSDRAGTQLKMSDTVLVISDYWRLGAQSNLGQDGIMHATECLLATNTPFDVINQCDIGSIIAESPLPKRIVFPCAIGINRRQLACLYAMASSGCHIYLSGDISITPEGTNDLSRLKEYCGVRSTSTRTLPNGLSVPVLTPTGATPCSTSTGIPMYRNRIGNGEIVYSPEPWECRAVHDTPVHQQELAASRMSNPYLDLLPALGAKPVQVSASAGIWRALRSESASGSRVVLFPQLTTDRGEPGPSGTVSTQVMGRTLLWGPAAGWPCAALLDAAGQPTTLTGAGTFRMDGKEVISSASPWIIAAQDGAAIDRSRGLLLSLAEGGKVRVSTSVTGLTASIIEWRNGKAVVVAILPVTQSGHLVELNMPANEMVLLAPNRMVEKVLSGLDR